MKAEDWTLPSGIVVPVVRAQVTLLPELSRGRGLLTTGQYRPHVVMGRSRNAWRCTTGELLQRIISVSCSSEAPTHSTRANPPRSILHSCTSQKRLQRSHSRGHIHHSGRLTRCRFRYDFVAPPTIIPKDKRIIVTAFFRTGDRLPSDQHPRCCWPHVSPLAESAQEWGPSFRMILTK